MVISELTLYNLLRDKVGEQQAQAITEYVESKVEKQISDKKDVFLTKDDKLELVSIIKDSKIDTIKWMFGFFVVIMLSIIGLYLK